MNMQVFLFENNLKMLEGLASKLQEQISSNNFILLKNKFTILTRETITAEYLSMQLVKKQVPSLSFETLRLVDFLDELKSEFLQKKGLEKLSPFYAEVLLTQIIQESSFKSINSKTQTIFARELLKEYESSIEYNSQSYFQDTYKEIIQKFKTQKGNALTDNEIYQQILETKLSEFECIKSKKDFPLLLYGIYSLSNLQWLVLKKIHTYIPIEIYICKPTVLQFEGNNFQNLDSKHVLNQGFQIHVQENSFYNTTKVYFYEAPEIHREIDFVAKSIMGKIAESSSDFHLTRIKVIIPDEPSYAISIKNTFQKFGIPFVFTNDVYINRQTAYYNAVYTLIQLVFSNFDREIAIKLFQNPCFCPLFPSEVQEGVNTRIVVHSEHWNVLMNVLKIEGYLDKTHRTENGLLEAEDLTWEGLWRKAVLAMQGEIEGVQLADEVIQEIPNFIKITHSLLHDLLYLKQSKFTPKDFEVFFRELLNIYLDYNQGMPEEEIPLYEFQERLQEGIYKRILKTLKEISNSREERLPSELYLNFILEKLNQIRELSSQVLRYGVVVGSFVDTNDIVFDSIYVLGVDERRVPKRSAPNEYMLEHEYISARTKDYYLYSKASFYSIFHHAAKEIHISYVNRDSVGDKPIYPASTYRVLLEHFKDASLSTIPLFTYLEPNFEQYKDLGLDKESILTIWLKQFEKEQQIQNIFPHWDKENSNLEHAWKDFEFKDKLIAQHFIKKLESKNFLLPEEIPLKRFLLYLECPRKYFYTYTFRLQEEGDLETEPKNYQALKIREVQKVFLDLLFANPQSSLNDLKQVFQNEFIKKISSKPSLFNQVEWRKVEPKLEEIFSLFHQTLGTEFFVNLKFQGQEELGNIFPSGELFGRKVSGQLDLVYFRNGEANLVKFVFSKEIYWRPILELYLQRESFSGVISEKWKNISKINLQVFHLDRDWKFATPVLDEVVEDAIWNYLKSRWEEFTKQDKINFCAEPIKRKREEPEFSESPCRFCRFKKICHGYQIAYEDDERQEENSTFFKSLERKILKK